MAACCRLINLSCCCFTYCTSLCTNTIFCCCRSLCYFSVIPLVEARCINVFLNYLSTSTRKFLIAGCITSRVLRICLFKEVLSVFNKGFYFPKVFITCALTVCHFNFNLACFNEWVDFCL